MKVDFNEVADVIYWAVWIAAIFTMYSASLDNQTKHDDEKDEKD